MLLRTESGLHVDVECFVNARYGYDIRCEIVGADAAAALPPDCAPGFQDRFATAYVRELESWAAGAGAGATAWDGYAASVVCEAAVDLAAHRPSGRDPPAPSRHRLREDTITMKLGAYTACLHDKPLEEALAVLRELGLDSAEINSGGFLPAVHLPIDDIRASQDARDEYLGLFDAYGITLTALNCNGNPLHPDPEVGDKHARRRARRDRARRAARRQARRHDVGPARRARRRNRTVVDRRPVGQRLPRRPDYQWRGRRRYWKDIQARAADADVKVCIEMHPHNVVYNAATMERLATKIDATHVGAEMDPSHLFWQGMDPLAVIEQLGDLIYNAAAKDVRINPAAPDQRRARRSFRPRRARRARCGRPRRQYTVSRWPDESSWDFVAVGRGHDVDYWSAFLQAIERVDPDMAVNIEHEDQELDQIGGLRSAAETLLSAAGRARA